MSERTIVEPTDAAAPRPIVRNAKGRFVAGTGQLPKRKPGGHPGNLNSTKNPWAVYWKRRALRREDRWVLGLVRDYVPELIEDKGGEDEVSFAQRKVMELAAVARVCWALAMVAGNLEAVARFVTARRRGRPSRTSGSNGGRRSLRPSPST